ncbi:MAG: ATP-dependent DNA helicase RecG, partial [Anaerolineae bacterium]
MPTPFEKLEKILKLEQSQGFRNTAVIGGLDGFAGIWRKEALDETQDQAKIEQINDMADRLQLYAEADASARNETVSLLLDQLAGDLQPRTVRQPPLQKPGSASPPPPPPPPPRKEEPAAAVPSERPATGLDAPVTTLPGVSTAYTTRLRRLGIETVGDLLYHFPYRYDDYSSLKPIDQLEYGDETTVIGTIWETRSRKSRGGTEIITSVIADASGTIEAVWFNQPFLVRQLRAGRRIVLSGKIDEYLGRLIFQSPVWEPLERELIHTARLVPIYPLTRGITSRWLRRLMKRVVDHWTPRLKEYLPDSVRQRAHLTNLSAAIRQIHFPDSEDAARDARRRLSFDEFLFIQLGMLRQRQEWQSEAAEPVPTDEGLLDAFLKSLPYELTAAQQKCTAQILDDIAQSRPMSRLLQGDVGSGKTVVATTAMLMAVAAGRQAALMAPTEILAEQHYQTIVASLAGAEELGLGRPVSVVLLTGSLRRVERKEVYTALASGEADIVVGTHALIQEHVSFRDLALAVVDEQHRFGVVQRGTLRDKGNSPHLLVMSATPIPRSLALTVYGDLDLSIIDELPPGREEIETRWLLPRERERAYAFLRSQIESGRQAFIL